MKTENINLRIKPEKKEKLQLIADEKRRTITSLLEEKIEEILEENEMMTVITAETLFDNITEIAPGQKLGDLDIRIQFDDIDVWVRDVPPPYDYELETEKGEVDLEADWTEDRDYMLKVLEPIIEEGLLGS